MGLLWTFAMEISDRVSVGLRLSVCGKELVDWKISHLSTSLRKRF